MKANALWVVEERKIEIREYELEPLKADEVLIENKATGVCCWDSYLFRNQSTTGPLPFMFGHEGCGIVKEVGKDVHNFKPGDKVFCCGNDRGMFAEYYNVPATNVARIPDDVTDYAKWVAEPTNCVVNLLNNIRIDAGDNVVLVGAGYMGNLTLQGLTRGTQAGSVTAFDVREDRLDIARNYCSELYNPDTAAGKAKIREIQEAGGADIVIEFSASKSGFALANELTSRPDGPNLGGKLVIGSWHRQPMEFDGTLWHMSGIYVYNCSPMSNRYYPDIIRRTGELLAKGVYTPGELVTHVADYRDCYDIFCRSVDKEDGYVKGIITF